MSKSKNTSAPLTAAALLANRRFEDLSESEQATYGQLREREADQRVRRMVDNLNKQAAAR